MNKAFRITGLLALGFFALTAASRADEARGLFDGAGGAAFEAPHFKFAAAEPTGPTAAGHAVTRPGADLYYFSPQEAAEAARLFGRKRRQPGTLGYVFDPDVPADIQNQMRADLAFIQGIQGGKATPLHQQIFGSVDGPAYIRFFESRVTAIGMNDCGSAKAVACVIPFMDPSKMWLTQNFVKFSHPQISRMMVVFHEARHTEADNGNWPHANCPDPFKDADGRDLKSIWTGASLAGEPACDETPLGSYGSSTIMLKNIQKYCANCTDKVRMDAGIYADDQLKRITNPDARRQMEDDFAK